MIVATILGLVLGPAEQAFAWGRMAHRAATRLAEMRLTPEARAAIRDLLEPDETMADASTWADEHSRDIPGSASWHFVNVSINAPRYQPDDCHGNCVVSRLEEFRKTLADPKAPRARRRMALRYVIHLVEDAHQPMHVGDRRDRGGNNVQLEYLRDNFTNLHQVWDSGILRYGFRNEREVVNELVRLARQPEAEKWTEGRVEDWINESLEAARVAYRVPGSKEMVRSGMRLGQDYQNANLPIVTRRLSQAGVRLSEVLNEAFDTSEDSGTNAKSKNKVPAPHFNRSQQPNQKTNPQSRGNR